MDIAAGNKKKYAGYGQHHCQKLTPGRELSIFQRNPQDHHGRAGILDDRGGCCISCRNRGKIGIVHKHKPHDAIKYQLQKRRAFS